MAIGSDDAVFSLQTAMDTAAMARLETALEDLLYARLLAGRAQRMQFSIKARAFRRKVAVPCACAGMVCTLLFTLTGGLVVDGRRVDFWLVAFFGLMLPFIWLLDHVHDWLLRPWPRFWRAMARMHAAPILRQAKSALPFVAAYELTGTSLSYTRMRSEAAEPVWQHELHGVYAGGEGFTLFFKAPRAPTPYAIVMHEASPEFIEMIERLGIVREG